MTDKEKIAALEAELSKLMSHYNDGGSGSTYPKCWVERVLAEEQDARRKAEAELLSQGAAIKADVEKIGAMFDPERPGIIYFDFIPNAQAALARLSQARGGGV